MTERENKDPKEQNKERLTLREYIGALKPDPVATREEDDSPLTLDEYIRAIVPEEPVDVTLWKGVKRLYSSISSRLLHR